MQVANRETFIGPVRAKIIPILPFRPYPFGLVLPGLRVADVIGHSNQGLGHPYPAQEDPSGKISPGLFSVSGDVNDSVPSGSYSIDPGCGLW